MTLHVISTVFAACVPNDPIGCITPPSFITPGIDPVSGLPIGLIAFFNSFLRLLFAIAGLYGFINLIIAGYGFMSAGGDPKNITKAWDRIWQSLLGLIIIVCSFLIAAIIGLLIFKDPTAILNPKIK